jgi:hypothetical protein
MNFEYKTIDTKYPDKYKIVEELNTLGSEGWEVVNYKEQQPEKFGGEWKYNVLLKRAKPSTGKQIL